jgi:uncharacterized membrane protein
MLLWIILALSAAILWSASNLLDKFVESHEMRDPRLATVISGFVTLVLFIGFSLVYELFDGPLPQPSESSVYLAVLAGMCYSIAVLIYYSVLSHSEVSRATPLLSTRPIFVAFLALLFLGQPLKGIQYGGIVVIALGAFVVSLKSFDQIRFSSLTWLALLAAFCFSLRNVLISAAVGQDPHLAWQLLRWTGLGSAAVSFVMLAEHHPHLRKKAEKGIRHLVGIDALSVVAMLLFMIALSLGPVAVVSALVEIQPILVLAMATIITMLVPSFMHEAIDRKSMATKITGIVLILVGTGLVMLM